MKKGQPKYSAVKLGDVMITKDVSIHKTLINEFKPIVYIYEIHLHLYLYLDFYQLLCYDILIF